MLQVIPSGFEGGLQMDAAARRTVRSQAMRHFRQEQKRARQGGKRLAPRSALLVCSLTPRVGSGRNRSLLPARFHTNAKKTDGSEQTSDDGREENDEPSRLGQRSPLLSPDRSTFPVGNDLRDYEELQLPASPGGAAFYRLALQEMFGASLIGFGTQRPRSAGLLCFRGYVASTRSDLVQATDDTMCLMLPGCTLTDDRIVLDARKRHLTAIQSMQRSLKAVAASSSLSDAHAAISGAIELLFIDMFRPVSLGVKSLYGGLVHIVRIHLKTLAASQEPLSGWLLLQLRQIFLMYSLVMGSPLPVPVMTWRTIPHVLDLMPGQTDSLMRLAIQLPRLLQNASKVKRLERPNQSLSRDVLAELLRLERSLVGWQPETLRRDDDPQDDGSYHSIPFSNAQCQFMRLICLLLIRESIAGLADQPLKKESLATADKSAHTLCSLADYFIENADGALSKVMSVCAPLHFAHRWYEANGDRARACLVEERMQQLQREALFLSWESVLPWSLSSMYMNR